MVVLEVDHYSRDYSYFQIDRPLTKKLHKAEPEQTTCGPEYFMMRVRTAVEPTPAASPITAEDVKLEVRISPPKSAPRDFFCEGPIDLKVAEKGLVGNITPTTPPPAKTPGGLRLRLGNSSALQARWAKISHGISRRRIRLRVVLLPTRP